MQRYNPISIKLTIAGDRNGKTCLGERLDKHHFTSDHKSTIGVEFISKSYEITSNPVKLHVWDTSSQERFMAVTQYYYPGANAAIVTFDTTDANALTNAEKWIDRIRQKSTNSIYLVGTKADLIDERKISETQAEQFAQDKGLIYFGNTSAKTGEGVEEFFERVVTELYQQKKELNESVIHANTHWQKYRSLYIGALVGLGIALLAAGSYFLLPLIGLAAVVTTVVGTLGLGGSIATVLGFASLMGLISGMIDRSCYPKDSAESSPRLGLEGSSANMNKMLGAPMNPNQDKKATAKINLTPPQQKDSDMDENDAGYIPDNEDSFEEYNRNEVVCNVTIL